jgi:hypothetical protein
MKPSPSYRPEKLLKHIQKPSKNSKQVDPLMSISLETTKFLKISH